MALKNVNPTTTEAWAKLEAHFAEIKDTHLRSLFAENENRKEEFNIKFNDFDVDFSKNRIDSKTLELLVELADQAELKDAISKYFGGAKINATEGREVLHTALRTSKEVLVDGENVVEDVQATLAKIEGFTNKVVSGDWKGYTGKSITDVVNIGIGGSDLGPRMVVDALQYYKTPLTTHFVSNVDGDHVSEIIKDLNPETTLFLIVSKTFTTQETITNAMTIKEWFLQSATEADVAKHFAAVSTNAEAVASFGIDADNVFTMWNWVGGRFSLWSAVGVSISLAVGFDNFKALLDGASDMDSHFETASFEENIPVVLALLSIWYNNFFGAETEAILPYSQYLEKLTPYLQQAIMESNGKSVDRNGDAIDYQTGTIVWGSTGTNMQHAFMQLVHQGTKLIPCDFIGYEESLYGKEEHHNKLMSNYYGQQEALSNGKTKEEVIAEGKTSESVIPFKVFAGNKPSNSILIKKLTPKSLGSLISMYEHKIFVQGIIWNIYSYDQWGVELGKVMANKIYAEKYNS
ncbi:glucose-6-phosphate isomerase [Flavicella sediminum]|uniref:glucose-6-phosphate isomerase n=1 Tax=Flavicella sediminum TaxID=2585141 RepID=UPI00111D11D0|nr:glucose-6-phosphate isomerase [Flavicella sediminum]